MKLTIAAAVLALFRAVVAHAAADPARYMPAELIAQSAVPKPGTTILVGFRMTPRPGWHGYWSNPGDSGIAPSVHWTAPAGVRFGPLLHPAPELISADGISSFVHEGPHILLARMTVGRSVAAGTEIPIEARLDWAACTATQCVPLHATLTLDLTAGSGAASADATALTGAERKLPKPGGNGAFTVEGKALRLIVPASLRLDAAHVRFFPDQNDAFATAKASISKDDDRIAISAPVAGDVAGSLSGVVTDGRTSYRMTFDRSTVPAAPEEPAARTMTSESAEPQVKAEPGKAQTNQAPTVDPASTIPIVPWAAAIFLVAAAGALFVWRRRSAR